MKKITRLLALIMATCSMSSILGLMPKVQAATLLTPIREAYEAEIAEYNTNNPTNPAVLIETELSENDVEIPKYKPSSLKAAVPLNSAFGFEAINQKGGTPSLAVDPEVIKELLTSYGYKKYKYSVGGYPVIEQYLDEENGTLCAVSPSETYCGDITQQSITEEWKNYINGLGEAYYQKQKEYPIFFRKSGELPEIFNSDFQPYQYTFFSIGQAMGMFYRSSSTSDWIYFGGTQYVLECSKYTGEAQKGFAGYVCMDDKTGEESVVKVASEEVKPTEESDVKTPNTGQVTNDDKTILITSSLIASILIGLSATIIIYLAKRSRNRVHF